MKNLFNKALFISKIKEIFFLICLDILVIIYISFTTYNNFFTSRLKSINDGYSMHQYLNLKHEMISNHLFVIAISLALFSFILLGVNKRKEYLFLGHQPLSKSSIIFTKVLILLIIALINLFILNYTYILCYLKYKYIFDAININLIYLAIRTFCYDIVISLMVIAFCLVINFYVNNGVLAIILEIGIIILFPLLFSMISSKLQINPNTEFYNTYLYLKNKFSPMGFFYGNALWQVMLIPLIISIIVIFTCIKRLYANLKIENLNRHFYSKGFLIFLNILLCLSITLGINLTIVSILNPYIDIISLIVLFFSSYIGVNFLEKKYSLI